MRLNKVDLNLFVVFDAVYTERNLTRAAEVLCITQPAVSNALARLRKTFNDQLFVRSAQGMSPTPVAENIIGRVREALQLLDTSVQEGDSFEPAESDRMFRISMNDLTESMILPALMDELCRQAPHIVVGSYYTGRSDMSKALASGELDFAIDVPLVVDPQLCHVSLYKEEFVCMVRLDHPDIRGSLSLEQYLALGHVHISSRREGLGHVDVALNSLGLQRNVLMRVQHYLVAPRILRRTNLALTVPKRWAQRFDMQILELPFEVPPINSHLYWHKSAEEDGANRWVRERIIGLSRV